MGAESLRGPGTRRGSIDCRQEEEQHRHIDLDKRGTRVDRLQGYPVYRLAECKLYRKCTATEEMAHEARRLC